MNWRAQLATWKPEHQEFWRACLAMLREEHPRWTQEFCELQAFRNIRDILLSEGTLMLDDVPGWNATGRARTQAEIAALPRDDSEQRMAEARAHWKAQQRQSHADNEPDEPRRQFAGGRR